MRLKQVERSHRLAQKLMLGIIRVMSGRQASDILRSLFYRPELFGTHIPSCLQAAMRGPSEWSVGERELFAAFVLRKNQCPF
jgi:hypothetical protein